MKPNVVKLVQVDVPLTSRVTDGQDEFWHTHEFIEIFIILSGEIDNEFEDGKRHCRVGDMCVIFPGACHCFHRNGPCRHRDYMIRPDLFEKVCKNLDPAFFGTLSAKKYEYLTIEPNDILFLDQKTNAFFETTDVPRQKRMELTLVFYLVSLFYVGQTSDDEDSNSFRSQCLFLICSSYVYPDACKRIRKELGYNEKYFCKKFKKCFGTTLVDYVNAKRMGYAHYLLITTSDSIESICSQTGISSLSYFHKTFYKIYKKTPAKSRHDKLDIN